MAPMSAPAAKAFSLPVIRIAPMSASASKAASALPSSAASASFNAFMRCGRLRRMIPTRSRVSTMTFSGAMSSPGRATLALRWTKTLRQSFPTAKILLLQLRRLERELRRPDDVLGLEHEGHGVRDLLRNRSVRARCALEGLGVGAVPAHAVVQAGAARKKTLRLRIVH